jgi:hypothetical protein
MPFPCWKLLPHWAQHLFWLILGWLGMGGVP